MQKLLLTIFILTFLSCTESKSEYLGRKDYTITNNSDFKEISLSSNPLSFLKDQLIKPSGILLVGDFLIVRERRSDQVLHVLNLKEKEYKGIFVNKGEGPKEIKTAWKMSRIDDNSFLVIDVSQRKYLCYEIKDLISTSTPFKEEKLDQNGRTNSAYFNKNENKLFYIGQFIENHRLYEKDLNHGETTGYAKILDAAKEPNTIEVKNHISDAVSSSNSDNTFFALAYRNAPLIETYDYKSKTTKTTVIPSQEVPIYEAIKNDEGIVSTVAVVDETFFYFNDIHMTDKYIYALYRGNTFKDRKEKNNSTVYVFDLKLNPIRKYNLDRHILSFEIENDSIVYGLDVHSDVYPTIVQYDL